MAWDDFMAKNYSLHQHTCHPNEWNEKLQNILAPDEAKSKKTWLKTSRSNEDSTGHS